MIFIQLLKSLYYYNSTNISNIKTVFIELKLLKWEKYVNYIKVVQKYSINWTILLKKY